MARYLYSELSSAIQAHKRLLESANCAEHEKWIVRHEDWIEHMEKNLLPSGSGIDCGTALILDECHTERLVMTASYHHMDDSGGYDGWTEHKVVVTPSFTGGINLRISGRNRNDIKDYLHEVFYTALCADVTLEWYQYHFDGVPTWQWNHDAMTGKTSYSVVGRESINDSVTMQRCLATCASLDEARACIVQWCEANKQELKVREL